MNLKNVKRYSLAKRKSKVQLGMFANSDPEGREFLETVPDILVGKNFKELVRRIITARENKKPVIFMFGAHIIKCGLSRFVIEMMKKI